MHVLCYAYYNHDSGPKRILWHTIVTALVILKHFQLFDVN